MTRWRSQFWNRVGPEEVGWPHNISAFSHTLAGLQAITSNIDNFGGKYGTYRINCEKTKAMKIGPEQHPPILVMQQNVEYVGKLPYLGSYTSSNGHLGSEKLHQFFNGSVLYGQQLYHKLEYKVMSTDISACETALRRGRKWLWAHTTRCLPSPLPSAYTYTILGISWRDHASNEAVMSKALMEQLQYIAATRRREMAGYILRLQRERPAHTPMYWVQESRIRKRGRRKKTWRSTFQEDLKEMAWSLHDPLWPRQMWKLFVAGGTKSK